MRTLGVVVAGGRGERMGAGMPKALVVLAGRTLLDRSVARLVALCDEVVVAAPFALALADDRARAVGDPPGAEGPLAGMVAGLAASPHERALVVGVDLPMLRSASLLALLAELATSGAAAVLPAPGGRPQPLACALDGGAAPRLAACLERGERSAGRALATLAPRVLDDAALAALGIAAGEFFDVDTPEDLAAATWALTRAGREA